MQATIQAKGHGFQVTNVQVESGAIFRAFVFPMGSDFAAVNVERMTGKVATKADLNVARKMAIAAVKAGHSIDECKAIAERSV